MTNTYGKAVVAFGDNGRGFAVLYSYGAVRTYLRRFSPGNLVRLLLPNPPQALMVWEGELALDSALDCRVDGRWRPCSRDELDQALADWARAPDDFTDPPRPEAPG